MYKQILNHLAKLTSLIKWLSVFFKLSVCVFESCCSLLNFRYCTCSKQGVPRHSGNCKVQRHSKRVCDMIRTHRQMHHIDKYSAKLNHLTKILWRPVGLNGWVLIYESSGCVFESHCSHLNFRYHAYSEQRFLNIQGTTDFRFTFKHVCDIIRTQNQMHHINKYSQHNSII